jgi:hypothetical protein
LENVDARKSGGNVCWKRLKTFTILFLVSSVASSVPLHKTYRIYRLENKPFRNSFMTVEPKLHGYVGKQNKIMISRITDFKINCSCITSAKIEIILGRY